MTRIPLDKIVIALFDLYADGQYHISKGLPSHPMLAPLLELTAEEESYLTKGGKLPLTDEKREAYQKHKGRRVFKIVEALRELGLIEIKEGTRTTNTVYRATPFGLQVFQGYSTFATAKKAGMTVSDIIKRLNLNTRDTATHRRVKP